MTDTYGLLLAAGAACGAVAAILLVVRPVLRWLQRQAAIYDVLVGVPAIEGVRDAQPGLFARVTLIEQSQARTQEQITDLLTQLSRTQDLLAAHITGPDHRSGPAVVQVLPESSQPR